MVLYMAWVDPGVAFGSQHMVEDEDVVGFSYSHTENAFATMTVSVRNPRVGPLSAGRKVWAWFSWYDHETDAVYPLMLGRLVGVPNDLMADVVDFDFVARPQNWYAVKEVFADSLRVLPHYDPVWYDDSRRFDPDVVLEGRSAVWHIDPVTHDLTISDVLVGDEVVVFDGDEVVEGTLRMNVANVPVTRVRVFAEIVWDQMVHGSMSLTSRVLSAWGTGNIIRSIAQKSIAQGWPKEGAGIGSGWTVGASQITARHEFVTKSGSVSINVEPPDPEEIESLWLGETNRSKSATIMVNSPDDVPPEGDDAWVWTAGVGAGGFVEFHKWGFEVGDRSQNRPPSSYSSIGFRNYVSPENEYRVSLSVTFDPVRTQREMVEFVLEADLQPVLTDPDGDDFEDLSFTSANVSHELDDPVLSGTPLDDSRSRTYLGKERGQQSLRHLMLVARAVIRNSSRCVTIGGRVTSFSKWYAATLRDNVSFIEPRILNGTATGKVVEKTLTFSGGDLDASLMFGCAVGRDGAVTAQPGQPTYCSAEYVGSQYQRFSGAVEVVPSDEDLGYSPPEIAPQDDGIVFSNNGVSSVRGGPVCIVVAVGNYSMQMGVKNDFGSAAQAAARTSRYPGQTSNVNKAMSENFLAAIEELNPRIEVTFRPLDGDWTTHYYVATQPLYVPRMINLET